MTTQEYIIILIGIITLVIAGKRILKLFEKKSSPCGGCTGCDVKNSYHKSCGEKDLPKNILG